MVSDVPKAPGTAGVDPPPRADPGVLVAPRVYNREGGVQTYLRLAGRALAERGRLDAVVSLADTDLDGAAAAAEHGFRFRGAGHGFLRFAAATARATRPDGWALVGHARPAPLALALRQAGRLGAYGVIVHGVEVWAAVPPWQRWALQTADVVVCTTPFTAEKVQEHNRIADDRIRILPLTVAPDRFPARSPSGAAGGPLHLLTVSRLSTGAPDKGVDHAVEAVGLLAHRGVDVRYSVVGDGDDRPRLEALAREAGADGHVRFHGRLPDDDLAALYSSADLFVLPSKREGFGLVLLEAMRAGLPLVATPEGGIRHVLRDGHNGVGVPYGDPAALADAVARLADPAVRVPLAEVALADFDARFSYAAFSDRLADIADHLSLAAK